MIFMRWFARIVLLSPLVVIAVGLVCTLIPGAAEVLSKIFWETLGEVDSFAYACQMIQLGMGYETLSPEAFGRSMLQMISVEVLDAMVLGACVFLLKSIALSFNRRYIARYAQPEWVLTVAGVILGVVLLKASGFLKQDSRAIAAGIFIIVCMLYGVLHMLGMGRNLTRGGTYQARLFGTIIDLLLGILGNGLTAFCAVIMITCMMQGPSMVRDGGSAVILLLWFACACGTLYLSSWLLRILRPGRSG